MLETLQQRAREQQRPESFDDDLEVLKVLEESLTTIESHGVRFYFLASESR